MVPKKVYDCKNIWFQKKESLKKKKAETCRNDKTYEKQTENVQQLQKFKTVFFPGWKRPKKNQE